MTSAELTEWMAYYKLEPFDEQRADLRSAIVASTTANAAPRRRGARVYHVQDFMPYRPPASAASIRAGLEHLVVRKKDGGHTDPKS